MIPSIAIAGEYLPTLDAHLATNAAIAHSRDALGCQVDSTWVATTDLNEATFRRHQAIWIAPGSPYRDMDRTLWAIRYARENNVPCFGTCGGFQHMIIEYARNVLGFKDAQHAEYDPNASNLFVSQLACSLVGRELQLTFVPDSQVAGWYGTLNAVEHYYCRFGVDPDRVPLLRSGPLKIVGSDAEGEIRVVELPGHAFYVGTLFVPQMRSTPQAPHPLVNAFVKAASRIVTEH